MSKSVVAFFATARTGLGHLQRVGAIARALNLLRPDIPLTLICNAATDGMPSSALTAFTHIVREEKTGMADAAIALGATVVVSDMAAVPGIERVGERRALILRECPEDRLATLALPDGRAWDHVIVPNPESHWRPNVPRSFATDLSAVGWIRRTAGPREPEDDAEGVVLATGGGGSEATRRALYPILEAILTRVREKTPFRLRQALGPRAQGDAMDGVDDVFDPGPALHHVFRRADIVISTAGYNSVLELAGTDTPALLAAIPRSFDDQQARVRAWGPMLGHALEPGGEAEAADWLASQIRNPRRRPPLDLGPDGAEAAARVLARLT